MQNLIGCHTDNFCKQFGPRSGPTWILMVFLKEFIEKVNFEKSHLTTKKHAKSKYLNIRSDSITDLTCNHFQYFGHLLKFWYLLYSYFMPVCSIVKTITPRCRGRPDSQLHEAERPSAIVHQVVHGTEG